MKPNIINLKDTKKKILECEEMLIIMPFNANGDIFNKNRYEVFDFRRNGQKIFILLEKEKKKEEVDFDNPK